MKIHLMGICGTGMASLAGLLKEKGYNITGSDDNFHPPMGDMVKKLKIPLFKDYQPENIPPGVDLVIIGNVISRGNPEAEYVLNKNIPFKSMPQALYEFFIRKNISIVIAGTHGKTTTASLLAWCLEVIGKKPSFAIGGIAKNYGRNFQLGKKGYFIAEGDEYETSFFDKGPKFTHYFPQYLILNAIEYDHADIFSSKKEYLTVFKRLVNIVPQRGLILYCGESPLTQKAIEKAFTEAQSFGFSNHTTWQATDIHYENSIAYFSVLKKGKSFGKFKIPLIGKFNILNALAAIALLYNLGFYYWQIGKALSTFQGVKKRLEKIAERKGIILYDDFAHHPTSIEKVINTLRENYPTQKIWAILEPRSWSLRRNVFQNELASAFKKANEVIIAEVYQKEKIPPRQILNVNRLVQDITANGSKAYFLPTSDKILDFLKENLSPNDIIVVMSNGYFDNLAENLKELILKF
ncbi:MAG: UDP-N-acetylmuramate:L-alanyl-gamma-D-glutamyl-meso-diaminopimelate ligase, partial [Candidatus Aminicenantia bacterium]